MTEQVDYLPDYIACRDFLQSKIKAINPDSPIGHQALKGILTSFIVDSQKDLEKKCAEHGFSKEDATAIWKIITDSTLPWERIDLIINDLCPPFLKLLNKWDKIKIGSIQLTTVGTAIGYMHYRKIVGDAPELSKWIS